jgi:Flp pilus assembly protein TadG
MRSMLDLFNKLKVPSKNNNLKLKPKKTARKSKGQSLVEFAISLPIIILLFSGVIEYGFVLNFYLSLLDATRESARFYSNADPFLADGVTDDPAFYAGAAAMVRASLDPQVVNPSYEGRRIVLDQNADDVIISVYRSSGGNVVHTNTTPYHLYNNFEPIFTDEFGNIDSLIESRLVSGSPNAGILLVEVHYNYHQVLGLPWLAPFVPDPLHLRAYTIMPLNAAEPAASP